MEDFIINGNTEIYDIKVLNCSVYHSPNGDARCYRSYNYFIIIINDLVEVCLPITLDEKDYIIDLVPNAEYNDNWKKYIKLKNEQYKIQLNYNINLLEKILNIDSLNFNHLKLIEHLENKNYIEILKDKKYIIKPLLINRIINYFNNGRMFVNIIHINYRESNYRDGSHTQSPNIDFNIYEIQLFTNKQNKLINYNIFKNKTELMNELKIRKQNKKYKILNFGREFTEGCTTIIGKNHSSNSKKTIECIIIEEIDDDIENLINSNLIEFDEKMDNNINKNLASKLEEAKLYIDL
jgi:hypothetical protein